jgi:hypothetical protein
MEEVCVRRGCPFVGGVGELGSHDASASAARRRRWERSNPWNWEAWRFDPSLFCWAAHTRERLVVIRCLGPRMHCRRRSPDLVPGLGRSQLRSQGRAAAEEHAVSGSLAAVDGLIVVLESVKSRIGVVSLSKYDMPRLLTLLSLRLIWRWPRRRSPCDDAHSSMDRFETAWVWTRTNAVQHGRSMHAIKPHCPRQRLLRSSTTLDGIARFDFFCQVSI